MMGENTIIILLVLPAGTPRAAGDVLGIILLSSIQTENTLLLCRENPGEGKGTDGVLQVNDRARKKIQVSACLIWSPAVEYSPSAFHPAAPPRLFLSYFWRINTRHGLQLSESNATAAELIYAS